MIWDVTVLTRSGDVFERVLCFEWQDVEIALWTAHCMHCGWRVERLA